MRFVARSLSWVLVAILAAAIGWTCYYFAGIALFRYPDFDGALNLNVAKSLLDGHGYRSFYDEWVPFFPETNAPFVFPATVSLAVFGTSPLGAQFVNLVYLGALLVLTYLLVARLTSPLAGVTAVFVVLQTPGLSTNGMNGYGEVPALTFMFAGCLVLRGAVGSDDRRLTALGGVLLALSYLTKTVALIWIPAIIVCFLAARPGKRWRADVILLALAIGLPVLAWELYRLATLHGWAAYLHWWSTKFADILDRAGPSTRLTDTPGLWNKAQVHLALLEAWLGFPARWFTCAFFVSLAFAAIAVITRLRTDARGRFVFAALSVTAALYLTWWILLTPTQEAWLRRVTNGLVVSEIVAVIAICRLISSRNTFTAATLVVLASGSIFTVAHNQLLWDRPGEQAGIAAQRAFFEQVAALPPEARLYAAAWYQSPVAALTTGRRFYDFTRHSRAEIASSAVPQFLVIEEVALYEHGWLEKILDRCVCEPRFANGGGRIYRIQGIRDDEHQSIPQTIFVTADSQGFGNGFYSGEADMRWASARAEFRLPASDFEWLLLWLHAPEPEKMTSAPGPSILEIRRGECLLAREQLSIGENHLLAKNRCRDGIFGDTLEFRMNGHLALAAIAPDTRQLSWLFRRMEMMSVPSRTEISRARERLGP